MSLEIALVFDLKTDYKHEPGLHPDDLAELDEEETIAGMEQAMSSLGHKPVRVGNLKHLVHALTNGKHETWDLVWNVAEGIRGTARESQVPGLLEAYQLPYTFSDAMTLAIVHDKIMTKIQLRQKGVATAPFTVVSWRDAFKPRTLDGWRESFLGAPAGFQAFSADVPAMFVKPAMEGTSKGIYSYNKAQSPHELNDAIVKLRERFPTQDLLVEPFLQGRECSISVLGTGASSRVIGISDFLFKPGTKTDYLTSDVKSDVSMKCTYYEKANDSQLAAACDLALAAWRAIGCRDAGRIDVRFASSAEHAQPAILEINALPGLRQNWSNLPEAAETMGIDYKTLINGILQSALQSALQSGQHKANGETGVH